MPVVINTESVKRKFARESMEWLDSIPEERHDWCDALIAGAIDECRGNLTKALELAKSIYVANPNPPDEPYIVDVPESQLPTIPQGFAGSEVVSDIPDPLKGPPTKTVKVTNILRDSEGRIIKTTTEENEVEETES